MKLKLDSSKFNEGLNFLKKDYKIFAPVIMPFKGTFSDTDMIRYKEVNTFEEMEFAQKSNFSPKEVVLPINQVLFYFTEKEFKESDLDNKKILIFLRACDINGIKRLDEIYLNNGEEKDYFYKHIREKIKFALVGCKESFRNCFCVSMDSNKTDNYSLGLNIEGETLYLDIKDNEFEVFNGEPSEFDVSHVTENLISIDIPENIDSNEIIGNPIWDEYDTRCIGCGRCNFVCPTCSCFTMQDIFYKENENVGERRRVWASCQVDGYTDIAGGNSFRKKQGERMRFKTMHKINDFKKRFGYNMCVGCGRCDDACPQYISFSKCIEKINDLVTSKEEI
ncbi:MULTISPECIES: anaerobic sulfite reductase subunit AsrA [unclassified Clostridioides]|uniref:anaerobic sulfite reductase subunit AsrA n=1 Tax=unclassified Clostridioides TaxID=2635829 RepID=UPI001D0C1951|nr:anaerobic sulfite reductase subunit AsrA [Clostridioides sp. ES-S-0001-02]MCC0638897.1 anaerobic sulfite reductase subunit AsrA [Clostridioides sp. ES-S-0049-03]MCC0652269.1 anaerobic sulfite reductase subunit AsrA [Clostridioides sp. ES-S-0001-03]MCC0673643.1 anaerobic sulfite reductase subunit AsrA [Clostridioides sp. ES-S-0145-01]MCC0675286.1 anaerobic sulfite reductase subunit AsrA [Clostridioides sp. ES-W-0018-02]MCC0679904.1 anaerobic sulfite reductase subunit AsrA [Clostridioides sp.